jgi:hypothetical protein
VDLKVALVGKGGERYTAHPSGTLAAGEALFLALDSFTPVPPAGFRAARVEIVRGGSQPNRRIVVPLN